MERYMQGELLMLLFPIIGALIGWFTNYLAVRMLFRPHKVVDLKLFTLQGLIPKRRKEVATNIATTIEKDILSVKDIAKVLKSISWKEGAEKNIGKIIRRQLTEGPLSKIPLGSMIADAVMPKIEPVLTQEIIKLLEKLLENLVDNFEQKLDLHAFIFNRINHFDTEQLESVVLKVARRELRHIELLGALLGFIIGTLQVGIMMLT